MARTPLGTKRGRLLLILVGVVAGYLVGLLLEAKLGWERARLVTMPVGGLLSGLIGRFTLARFREGARPRAPRA